MYWDTFVQVASDFVSSGTTQQTITGLSYAVLANTKYEFEVVLTGQASDTAGVQFGVFFSAAGSTGSYVGIGGTTTTTSAYGGNVTGTQSGAVFWTETAVEKSVFYKGIISIGANAGNITVDLTKQTSGTATVRAGSILKIKKCI